MSDLEATLFDGVDDTIETVAHKDENQGATENAFEPDDDVNEDGDNDDLFGDGNDDDNEDVNANVANTDDIATSVNPLEYEEEDPEQEDYEERGVHHERIAQIDLAAYPEPLKSGIWHARLPNYLAIEPTPFNAETWKPDLMTADGQETSALDDAGYIRYRQSESGELESNARVVQWDDGTYSLQLGDELFDMDLNKAPGVMFPGGSANLDIDSNSLSQAAPRSFLVSHHDYVGLFESEAAIYGTLSFRPVNLQSRTHKKLASRVADRYAKQRSVKVTTVDQDPELEQRRKVIERQTRAKRDPVRSARNAEAKRRHAKYKAHREGGTRLQYADDRGGRHSERFDFDMDDDEDYGPDSRHRDEYDIDGDFVVGSDDEEEEPQQDESDQEEDDLDAMEARLERRRQQDRSR